MSTRSLAGIADSPPHEQPPRHVEEWQAALCRRLAEIAKDRVDVALTPPRLLRLHRVHVTGTRVALAVWRGLDADAGKELFEFGAGAVGAS